MEQCACHTIVFNHFFFLFKLNDVCRADKASDFPSMLFGRLNRIQRYIASLVILFHSHARILISAHMHSAHLCNLRDWRKKVKITMCSQSRYRLLCYVLQGLLCTETATKTKKWVKRIFPLRNLIEIRRLSSSSPSPSSSSPSLQL